jgi:hypothetical protein
MVRANGARGEAGFSRPGKILPEETPIRREVTCFAFWGWLGALLLAGCDGGGGPAATPAGPDAAASADAGAGGAVPPGVDSGLPDGPAEAAGDGPSGPFVPAPHAPLPQVVNSGGPVIGAPKVLPILYTGDTGASDIEGFVRELTQTTYWTTTTSEYGVGPLTMLPTVTLSGVAPAKVSDAELQAMLLESTSGANPAWGAPDASTVYLFALPSGTIEIDSNGACCTDYDGYHSETTGGTIALPYVVACACPGFGGTAESTLHLRTIAISHEMVESATDPFPHLNPAFLHEDDDHLVWTSVTGGEVADMCVLDEDAYFIPVGSQYMIQRTWSNSAAAASQEPCVPVRTAGPYFNTFPALSNVPYFHLVGHATATQGIDIPLGGTRTIPLNLYSSAPTGGAWTVRVFDANDLLSGSPNLSLSLDRTSGQNGDTINLTITPHTADPKTGAEAFVLFSELGTPDTDTFRSSMMVGLVTN